MHILFVLIKPENYPKKVRGSPFSQRKQGRKWMRRETAVWGGMGLEVVSGFRQNRGRKMEVQEASAALDKRK